METNTFLQFPSNLQNVLTWSLDKGTSQTTRFHQGPEEAEHPSCFSWVSSPPATDAARAVAAMVLLPPAAAPQLALCPRKRGTVCFHPQQPGRGSLGEHLHSLALPGAG